MRSCRLRILATAAVFAGAVTLQVSAVAAADFAGENNYQIGCFTLEPPVNQRLSPGLNRGHANGEWAFCQVVIDGNALVGAEAAIGGDGTYGIELIVPTYTDFQNHNANGIVNVAVVGDYGDGATSFTDIDGDPFGDGDIPAGHPLIGDAHVLGAFANGSLTIAANIGTVTIPQGGALPLTVFETGPPTFSNPVTGIRIPVKIDGFGLAAANIDRIDFFLAIQFADDGLKKCRGGHHHFGQPFPCEDTPPPGPSANGAADWFSGPGPLWIGYRPQFTTGIATVPFKILESEQVLSSIHGVKFCDLDLDGSCSGERLVNGTEVTIWVCDLDGDDTDCTDPDDIVAVMTTGAVGVPGDDTMPFSSATLNITKRGQNINTTLDVLSMASSGAYWLFISRSCNKDGLGDLVVQVAEAIDPIFDQQTAPNPGDMVDGFTAIDGTGVGLNIFWRGTLACGDSVDGLDFGNIALDPAAGDPHTIGFWGASLIKSAINSDPAGADPLCGDEEAPGNNVLPVSDGLTTYTTPDQVATLIMNAAASCAAFNATINAASVDTTEEKLCEAAGHLPPKQFDNPLGQLLGALLNVESGLLPAGAFVNLQCLGIGADPTPVPLSQILTDACLDPAAFQALLDAINNLNPVGGFLPCLTVPTCPIDAKVTNDLCPI